LLLEYWNEKYVTGGREKCEKNKLWNECGEDATQNKKKGRADIK
jgi:hypothetical protein